MEHLLRRNGYRRLSGVLSVWGSDPCRQHEHEHVLMPGFTTFTTPYCRRLWQARLREGRAHHAVRDKKLRQQDGARFSPRKSAPLF